MQPRFNSGRQPVDLLWTGGWDSTFRALDLVLRLQHRVQPHYVLDQERRGTAFEIGAMLAIRRELAARDSGAAARLLPAHYLDRAALPPDEEVDVWFGELVRQRPLGSQYAWLAAFARFEGLTSLELSVHQDDRAFEFLKDCVVRDPGIPGGGYVLSADTEQAAMEMLRPFRFPLLTLTKPDMQRLVEQRRFTDLQAITWFCHSPDAGKPCGRCDPCFFAIAEGMAHRFPIRSRVVHELVRLKRRLRRR